jgi:hypothetical protein
MSLDAERIKASLARLRDVQPAIFGSGSHGFLLNAPLSEEEVQHFETLNAVQLPRGYRHFLTKIGNGGAGPFYGVFPLGMMDFLFGLRSWSEPDRFVGILSAPFPHETEWNDLSGNPDSGLSSVDTPDYEELVKKFDEHYWSGSVMDGAIPICHTGCALRIWLVITGAQVGQLWYDKRADLGGIMPLTQDDGSPLTFEPWYETWLEFCLREANIDH